jgi:hypothetical protein
MTHRAEAVTQAGPGGKHACFAWCECGWKGPTRLTQDEAKQDALDHLNQTAHAEAS